RFRRVQDFRAGPRRRTFFLRQGAVFAVDPVGEGYVFAAFDAVGVPARARVDRVVARAERDGNGVRARSAIEDVGRLDLRGAVDVDDLRDRIAAGVGKAAEGERNRRAGEGDAVRGFRPGRGSGEGAHC